MRPNVLASLEALAEAALDAAETYEMAAQWSNLPELKALFGQISKQRYAMVYNVDQKIRDQGANPRGTEMAAHSAQRLIARVRTTFVNERPRALIEECERADTGFIHILVTTDQSLLGQELGLLVRETHAEVVASLGQLAAAKLRLRSQGY